LFEVRRGELGQRQTADDGQGVQPHQLGVAAVGRGPHAVARHVLQPVLQELADGEPLGRGQEAPLLLGEQVGQLVGGFLARPARGRR
jgi:hypothetical protein